MEALNGIHVAWEFVEVFALLGGSFVSALLLFWITYSVDGVRDIIFFWHDKFETVLEEWNFGQPLEGKLQAGAIPIAQTLERRHTEAIVLRALAEKSRGNVGLFITYMVLSFTAIAIVFGGVFE